MSGARLVPIGVDVEIGATGSFSGNIVYPGDGASMEGADGTMFVLLGEPAYVAVVLVIRSGAVENPSGSSRHGV